MTGTRRTIQRPALALLADFDNFDPNGGFAPGFFAGARAECAGGISLRTTTLDFALPVVGPVSLVIYDLAGKHVRTLVSSALGAGHVRRPWDGRNEAGHATPSGLYFARLRTGGFDWTQKLLLIR